jgi:adenylate kinase
VHIPSGRAYNTISNPPLVAGFDDITGEPLSRREADHPDVVRPRLEEEEIWAESFVEHYKECGACRTYNNSHCEKCIG